MGKKLTSQFFPRGKNGPAWFFPGEKTDWGEIPACYTGKIILSKNTGIIDLKPSGEARKAVNGGEPYPAFENLKSCTPLPLPFLFPPF